MVGQEVKTEENTLQKGQMQNAAQSTLNTLTQILSFFTDVAWLLLTETGDLEKNVISYLRINSHTFKNILRNTLIFFFVKP